MDNCTHEKKDICRNQCERWRPTKHHGCHHDVHMIDDFKRSSRRQNNIVRAQREQVRPSVKRSRVSEMDIDMVKESRTRLIIDEDVDKWNAALVVH